MSAAALIKKLRVTKVITETEDTRTFILEPVGWNPVCRSGQFLTFIFNTEFGERRRSYSISSSPELQEPLSITVKRIPNGEFSRPLTELTKPGDLLFTTGPAGFFTLKKDKQYDRYFFLAAGSGITPCYSLIKTVLWTTEKEVTLIYSSRSKKDTIFYRQLKALESEFRGRFRIHFLFSDSDKIETKRMSKFVLEQILREYPEGKEIFYICGPFEYMLTARIVLLGRTTAEHLVREDFSMLPRIIKPQPPDLAEHLVTLTIAGEKHRFPVQYPRTVLIAARERGLVLPYSCEAGRCGSCIASCTTGKIWMAYNEVLTDKEVAQGRILTCQSYPVDGDAEISIGT